MAKSGRKPKAGAQWRSGSVKRKRGSRSPKNTCPVGFANDRPNLQSDHEALRESESSLKAVLEAIPDLMFEVDEDGRFHGYHAPTHDVLYAPPSAFMGKTVSEVLPEDAASTIMQALRQAAEMGWHRGATYSLDLPAGRRWFQLSIQAKKRTAVGRRFVVLAHDITERMRAENALLESENRYRQLAETMPDAVLVGQDGKNVYANPAAARLLGAAVPEELIGLDVFSSIDPAQQEFARHQMQRVLADEDMPPFEDRFVRLDGSLVPVELSVSSLAWGGRPALQIVVRDVTERKRAAEELRATEKRFALAFHNSPGLMAISTLAEGRFLDVNDRFLSTLGYAREDVIGKSSTQLNIFADPGQRDALIDMLRRKGSIRNQEVLIRAQSGAIHVGLFSGERLRLGQEDHLFTTMMDITELRAAEDRLRQTEKLEAIGQLAGGVAHDSNNQLAGIMGYAELLIGSLREPPLKDMAGHIVTAARRIADLNMQLLAFARKGKFQSKPVDMHEVVAEVASILMHSIHKKIKITQALTAQSTEVLGDPAQLQSMVLNLAINGCDAMPKGGTLTLATEEVLLDDEFCRRQALDIPAGKYLRIGVSDMGIGMSPETRAHLFEPFFTTKEFGKGTGLGLASVYGAVKNHHGAIAVSSELGKGSVFKVYLPLIEGEKKRKTTEALAKPFGASVRILLADDEEIIRDTAVPMLRQLGHAVTVCTNGAAAIEYYGEHWREIDLVILDMVMPVMDGGEAFRAMKAINPDIQALLTSGYSIDGEAQEIMKEGMLGFLQKPFKMSELAGKITDALQKK